MSGHAGNPKPNAVDRIPEPDAPLRIIIERPDPPLRPSQCRSFVRRNVAIHLPVVLEGFLNEALKGGTTQMKLVLDTVVSGPPPPKEKFVKGPIETLLEKLNRECPE